MTDAKIDRLYTALWLSHELGELTRLLPWPAAGGCAIAAAWSAGTGSPWGAAACLAAAPALLGILRLLQALSGRLCGACVRRINKEMFGKGRWPGKEAI